MATVQIKGRVPEDVAALFDLAVDIMARTSKVERRHRGGATRTVAFTQNAAVIAALTDWADAVIDAVTAALKRGDAVNLVGFGSFSVKARAARTGLNPRTKEAIQIPASNNPVFKAGKALKDAVN